MFARVHTQATYSNVNAEHRYIYIWHVMYMCIW